MDLNRAARPQIGLTFPSLAEMALGLLRGEPYQVLVDRYRDRCDHQEVIGDSGVVYQLDVQAFWDSGKPGDLRVMASIDDRGLRAFSPFSCDFIMAPDWQ